MTELTNYTCFIINKYYMWYSSLINKNLNTTFHGVYTEKHHILPKSLGGSDDKRNIIAVPAREHYILHRLLTKFTVGHDKAKMCFALHSFFHLKNRYRKLPSFNTTSPSKIYEISKKEISNYKKSNPNYYKKDVYTIKHKLTNKSYTGTRKKLRDLSSLTHQELYNLITRRNKCLKGWGLLLENGSFSFDIPMKSIKTISKICPHCNISVDMRNYGKWHGKNCKTINPEKYNESLNSALINLSKAWKKV